MFTEDGTGEIGAFKGVRFEPAECVGLCVHIGGGEEKGERPGGKTDD